MSDEGESSASNDLFHKWPPLFGGKKPATNKDESPGIVWNDDAAKQGHTCCEGGC